MFTEKTWDIIFSIVWRLTLSAVFVYSYIAGLYWIGATAAFFWSATQLGISVRRVIQLVRKLPVDEA